jgi:hypothetical protein
MKDLKIIPTVESFITKEENPRVCKTVNLLDLVKTVCLVPSGREDIDRGLASDSDTK